MRLAAIQCQSPAPFAFGARGTHQRSFARNGRWRTDPSLRAIAVDDVTTEAREMGVTFERIHEDFGADVVGMDLSGGLSEAEGELVKRALDRFTLLRFRGQTPKPDDEAKLLRCLPHDEELINHPSYKSAFPNRVPGYPFMAIRANNWDVKELNEHYGLDHLVDTPLARVFKSKPVWHMDMSYNVPPPKYSYIHCKLSPPEAPVTVFASTVKAYSLLSDERKKLAHTLRAKNFDLFGYVKAMFNQESPLVNNGVCMDASGIERVQAAGIRVGDTIVPFVTEEQGTGIRSLFASPYIMHSFEGMSMEASHALLKEFFEPVTTERAWNAKLQPGDVLVWKNRQLIHAAPPEDTYNGARLLHTVFWESKEPFPTVQED